MEALYYDGATVLIFFVCFLIFYKKGFLSSAMQLVGLAVALFAAIWVINHFAEPIYDKYLYPRILSAVTGKLEAFYAGNTGIGSGLIGSAVEKFLSEGNTGLSVGQQAEVLVANKLQKILMTAIKVVLFAVAFLIAQLLVKLITKLLTDVNEVPLVGGLNKILGGAFGLVVALAILLVGSALIHILSGRFDNEWLQQDVIQSTKLFSFIFNNNPLIG